MKTIVKNRKQKIYSAFGFLLESEIDLPELIPGEGITEVGIIFGQIPEALHAPEEKNPWYEMSSDEYILRVEGVAGFYVSKGNVIIIEADQKATEDTIRLYLLSTVFAVLLAQRSYLVLHGAAVVFRERAALFLGHSGAGKSLIANGFYMRNQRVIADEICAIKVIDNRVMIFPGIAQINVWKSCLKGEFDSMETFVPVREGLLKYAVSIGDSHSFQMKPTEVCNLLALKESNGPASEIKMLTGIEKMNQILRNSYFKSLLELTLGKKEFFRLCAAVGNGCVLKELVKNRDVLSHTQLVDVISMELGI